LGDVGSAEASRWDVSVVGNTRRDKGQQRRANQKSSEILFRERKWGEPGLGFSRNKP